VPNKVAHPGLRREEFSLSAGPRDLILIDGSNTTERGCGRSGRGKGKNEQVASEGKAAAAESCDEGLALVESRKLGPPAPPPGGRGERGSSRGKEFGEGEGGSPYILRVDGLSEGRPRVLEESSMGAITNQCQSVAALITPGNYSG